MKLQPVPSRFFLLLAALTVVGCADGTPTQVVPTAESILQPQANGAQPFTVYTQNVYLGGDTGPLFSLDLSNLPAVVAATQAFRAQVQTSAIGERASGFVDEIAARRPHLVGLQEVFQFAVLDQAAGGAVIGGADLLAEIQGRIAARGLPYEVADAQPTTTVGLPLSPTTVLVATDRLVVLRRTDVAPTSTAKGTYAASVPLGPFNVRRGWIRLSTEHDGILYHFVTTHLETQSITPIQAAQANELIHSVTAGLDGVTLIGGDLNSDAANPGAPSWTPTYGTLLAAGFLDAWTRSHPKKGDAGYTCCQRVDLTNPVSLLDQRIDFVLVRDARGVQPAAGLGAYAVEIVGEELTDRTTSGRWRADHAGLVAAFRLPRGLGDPH